MKLKDREIVTRFPYRGWGLLHQAACDVRFWFWFVLITEGKVWDLRRREGCAETWGMAFLFQLPPTPPQIKDQISRCICTIPDCLLLLPLQLF